MMPKRPNVNVSSEIHNKDQRLLETFPKCHPFWRAHPSLIWMNKLNHRNKANQACDKV